ncbi:MAG: Integral membrane protein YggT, involved in response to extracytoplasmic stress (osmotic shock) [uncultured Thermomicrobiales bacterium]|jgi:YggT family protein|uniref:Integral membrane protein YggT, involved in response to extracytoplasmic stress (Osmotic shock) n=1 Tax=uncultured Thermomicrobiales bacterium TaxID=1645740 RepID=A0A6J4VQD2_9BACT|nr:MAG: Integral membrane protein YggT, involved in response to extracytoplasmic stress (osmotic shock) [uncultured Thermomicrobiales bacterium]
MPASFIGFLGVFINILQLLFLARLVALLIDRTGSNAITRLLVDLTEPILAPVRRLLPSTGGLDFSPTVVLILLVVLQNVISSSV